MQQNTTQYQPPSWRTMPWCTARDRHSASAPPPRVSKSSGSTAASGAAVSCMPGRGHKRVQRGVPVQSFQVPGKKMASRHSKSSIRCYDGAMHKTAVFIDLPFEMCSHGHGCGTTGKTPVPPVQEENILVENSHFRCALGAIWWARSLKHHPTNKTVKTYKFQTHRNKSEIGSLRQEKTSAYVGPYCRWYWSSKP